MTTYLTLWNNDTFTLTRASNIRELELALDEEGNPRDETVTTYVLPADWRSIVQDNISCRIGLVLHGGNSPDLRDLPEVDFD